MTYTLARILSASALGVLVTGCATVPGDPYYEPPRYQVYEQPGYIYNARVPRARGDLLGPATAARLLRRARPA